MSWVVHKFGGTSVAGAERYKNVLKIMQTEPGQKKAIVVSAMSKVTDALIELCDLARKQDSHYTLKLMALKKRHIETVYELLPPAQQAPLLKVLDEDFNRIEEILRGLWHVQTASEFTVELVSGHGEIWSAQLLNAYAQSQGMDCSWLDARKVLIVESGLTAVTVDWAASQAKVNQWEEQASQNKRHSWVIVTGFIASTPDGIATTLKRNGSDFSGAIFGKLLKASSITIWTDVDGVLSADPRLVPEAVVLKDLSYQETTELAYFGAKVVHPSTMAPAIQDQIPIWIRNTFNPTQPGTLIHTHSTSKATVKGFATIDQVCVINVEGTGMMGVPGVAQRLFGALREVNVSVIMISQASSEQSICFAIPAAQAKTAEKAVTQTFALEIQTGAIQSVHVDEHCSILAAVGDNMVDRPGVSGKLFAALGRAGVNVRAIAQGSSERNISMIIARHDSARALRAAHADFFLSDHTISIGLIGVGGIGKSLLKQITTAQQKLKHDLKIDLQIRAVADSKKMYLIDKLITADEDVALLLATKGIELNFTELASHVRPDYLPHGVLIDCTASDKVADFYPQWLERGLHVITPNKKANTKEQTTYDKLRAAVRQSSRHYLYETTVGAGLPIINTLRELHRTGDKIVSIEGVLSGTLSYIFNALADGRTFSEAVKKAKELGYTEPDPRDDLSGKDFARKLVILAREIGFQIEVEQVQIEPLISSALLQGSVDEFMQKVGTEDAGFANKIASARAQSETLRFVGQIDGSGKASIKIKHYPASHAFSRLTGTDNIVAFHTQRYHTQPLIVQGPGAGPEVTAAGVFADLLRLSSYLGAPL